VCVLAEGLWPATALAALGLFVMTLADGLLLLRTPHIEIERHVPDRLAVGREAEFELALKNPGAQPVEVDLFDELPRDLCGQDPHFADVRVPAGESSTLRYRVVPRERGERALGVAAALVRSPFGLLRRRELCPAGAPAQVFPDASRFLRPEALDTRRLLALLGVKPAARQGDGMDFDSLRDYVPGDDPRRLDWRASGRRGRLVMRQYRHEESHRVIVAIDSSRLMGARGAASEEGPGRSKLDHCVDASLALVYAALGSGDRAGLVVFDREIHARVAPCARRAELGLFVAALRDVQPRLVEADYRALCRSLLAQAGGRSLFVILTDFADAPGAAVQAPLALLARRHRVLLVAVRDPVFGDSSAQGRAAKSDLYRQIVLDELLREREEALAKLRRSGVQTLDLPHGELTAPVLNRYLAIRNDA
jgi:uncharacterized protein (DUF58 family)